MSFKFKNLKGVDFSMKLMMVDNSLIRLQFWDISGKHNSNFRNQKDI